jgi:hypothetical protein
MFSNAESPLTSILARTLAGLASAAALLILCTIAAGRGALEARPTERAAAAAGVATDDDDDDDKEEEEEKKGEDEGDDDDGDDEKPEKDEPEKKGDEGSDGDSGTTSGLTPQQKDLKERLESYLHPTSLGLLPDGRIKLQFDFKEKKEEHQAIFTRKFGAGMKDPFRWTIREEEFVVGGEPGLRISDKGMALIDLWVIDDVEAEMDLLQHINHTPNHIAAVVYAPEKANWIGSNYGSQCALFDKTGRAGKRVGKSDPVIFNNTGKIKLVVRGGAFEAHRQGRKKTEMKYSPAKNYVSGRIGFVWGGSVACTITGLTITGKLDHKATMALLKKRAGEE